MAGRSLPWRILKHSAAPALSAVAAGPWVDGEQPVTSAAPDAALAFPCLLFLPVGSEVNDPAVSWRPREVKQPTMIYNLARRNGSPVLVTKETELWITAADHALLSGGQTLRWQVVGTPQGFGPPGKVFGAQATLKRVED